MPPKRWGHPPMMSPAEAQKEELLRYIKREIESNNFLGLLGEELDNMMKVLATCGSRREVYDWCQTLMIGEAVAAEIVKRRVSKGPPFDDCPAASDKAGGGGRQLGIAVRRGAKKRKSGTSISHTGDRTEVASLKPGLFECGCFATLHDLRGNCANCGRIICEQESAEVCYYCGMDPRSCVAYEVKLQEGFLSAAALEKNRENYDAAVSKRDELLRYSETRAKRTKVIDDQTAVFLSPKHAWMSVKEREKADEDEALAERRRKVAAMHRATGAYRVHLDIMNQNVSVGCQEMSIPPQGGGSSSEGSLSGAEHKEAFEEGGEEEEEEWRALPLPSLMQKIWYSLDGSVHASSAAISEPTATAAGDRVKKTPLHRMEEVSCRVQQNYFENDALLFLDVQREERECSSLLRPDGLSAVEEGKEEVGEANEETDATKEASNDPIPDRLFPTPAMQMKDDGVCLSMHQPWAGLLVAGVKLHEGRVWSTSYRGRLWIHAASAQPCNIAEVEQRYAKFIGPAHQLPKYYPTRVLLGYVYLTDCMDRTTYEASFTEEQRQEEESPHMFICTVGKALPFPLPMNGDHKLFRLTHKVHTAARKQLMEIV